MRNLQYSLSLESLPLHHSFSSLYQLLSSALTLQGTFLHQSIQLTDHLPPIRLKFPLISGYLLTGVFVGSYVLDLISDEQVHNLSFINDFALATIAFCAGSELYFPEIR